MKWFSRFFNLEEINARIEREQHSLTIKERDAARAELVQAKAVIEATIRSRNDAVARIGELNTEIASLKSRPIFAAAPDEEWALVEKAIRSLPAHGVGLHIYNKGDNFKSNVGLGISRSHKLPALALVAAVRAAGLLDPHPSPEPEKPKSFLDKLDELTTERSRGSASSLCAIRELVAAERAKQTATPPINPDNKPLPPGYTLPEGFGFTGEVRCPKKGEWFASGVSPWREAIIASGISVGVFNRPILLPRRRAEDKKPCRKP